MNEIKALTPKQDSFCVHYTTIGSETFSNGTKSAIAAKYSEKSAYSQACNLLKNPKIQERIKELHTENMQRNMITVDKVLADLEHDKLMARKAGQYGVAKGCTELQGKYLAMFTDNLSTNDIQKQRELDEAERAECMRFTQIRLREGNIGEPLSEAEIQKFRVDLEQAEQRNRAKGAQDAKSA